MGLKFTISFLLLLFGYFSVNAQSIVIDTSSTSKYLINKTEVGSKNIDNKPTQSEQEELTFSDRALSIGKGILNRLKARLNLEEAAESIKEKKDRFLKSESKPPEEGDT